MAAAGALATGTAGSASAATADEKCPKDVYEFCVFADPNYEGLFHGVKWGTNDGWVSIPRGGGGPGQDINISSLINNTNNEWKLYDSNQNYLLTVGKFHWLSGLGNANDKPRFLSIVK